MSYIPSTSWRLLLSPRKSPADADAVLPGLQTRLESAREIDDGATAIARVLADEALRDLSGIAHLMAASAERTSMEAELRSLFHALRRPTSMDLARLLELSSNPALATERRDVHALLMGLSLALLASIVADLPPAERARMATRGIGIVTDAWSSSRVEDVRVRCADLLVRIDEAITRSAEEGAS